MKFPRLANGASLTLTHAEGVIGGQLWPAALALCEHLVKTYTYDHQQQQPQQQHIESSNTSKQHCHLEQHHHQQQPQKDNYNNNRVQCVELGSGTGAVGLYAAAALGWKVTLTEHRPPLTSVLQSIPYSVDGTPEWDDPFLVEGMSGTGGSTLGGNETNINNDDWMLRNSNRLLDLLRHNVQQNISLFDDNHNNNNNNNNVPIVEELDWNIIEHAKRVASLTATTSLPSSSGFDVVLGSDVTYMTQSHESLARTIAHLLRKTTGKCLISHQERVMNFQGVDYQLESFQHALKDFNLQIVDVVPHPMITTDTDTDDDDDNNNKNENNGKIHKVCILEIRSM